MPLHRLPLRGRRLNPGRVRPGSPGGTSHEAEERLALKRLTDLDLRRADLARQVARAEKAEAAALEHAEPAATVELAQRLERALVAREVMDQRGKREIARGLQHHGDPDHAPGITR